MQVFFQTDIACGLQKLGIILENKIVLAWVTNVSTSPDLYIGFSKKY